MKDSIEKIQQKKVIKDFRRNKKEKIANKNYYNNIIKRKINKRSNNLLKKKLIIRNTFIPFKLKINQYNFRYKY